MKCFPRNVGIYLQVYIVLQPRLPTSTSSRRDNLISANKTTFFHLYRTTQLCFFTESTEDGRGRVRQWLRVVNWRQRAWNSCSLFQELSLYQFRKPEETHGRLKTACILAENRSVSRICHTKAVSSSSAPKQNFQSLLHVYKHLYQVSLRQSINQPHFTEIKGSL
jgi:hypothetical protein